MQEPKDKASLRYELSPATETVEGSASTKRARPGIVSLLIFGVAGALLIALAFMLVFAVLIGVALLVGGLLALVGFRRLTGRLATADEIARRHGVTPRDVQRILEEQGVRPSAVLNGRAMYDSRSVRVSEKRLRSAGGPILDAELVRPAGSSDQQDPLLLRSASKENSPTVIDVLDSNSDSEQQHRPQ